MKANLMPAALLGAIAYIITNSVYSGAQVADMGVTVVPASYAEYGLPPIVSLVFLILKSGFPSLSGTIDKILKLLSLGKVGLLTPPPKTSNNLLRLLNQVEVEASSLGLPVDLSALRTPALAALKPKPAPPAEKPTTEVKK